MMLPLFHVALITCNLFSDPARGESSQDVSHVSFDRAPKGLRVRRKVSEHAGIQYVWNSTRI